MFFKSVTCQTSGSSDICVLPGTMLAKIVIIQGTRAVSQGARSSSEMYTHFVLSPLAQINSRRFHYSCSSVPPLRNSMQFGLRDQPSSQILPRKGVIANESLMSIMYRGHGGFWREGHRNLVLTYHRQWSEKQPPHTHHEHTTDMPLSLLLYPLSRWWVDASGCVHYR